VLADVEEDVRKRIAYVARRSQRAHVVAAEEHRAGASEDPIHAARNARGDRLHRRAERLLAARLEDQVEVVALHGVMDEPRLALLACVAERAAKRSHEPARSE
jgi:hypothetical protein